MRRRRTFLLIFVILVLLLVVGLIALWRLRGGSLFGSTDSGGEDVSTERPLLPILQATPVPQTQFVVVALQTVPRGMRVPPDAIEVREWRLDDRDFPKDPALKLSEVVGRIARVDILAQRPVSLSMLADLSLGEGSEMALAIPKGMVAFALPVRKMSAVANAIHRNDRVDVLISLSMIEVDVDWQIKEPVKYFGGDPVLAEPQPEGEQIARLVSQYTVQNALVLDVDLWETLPQVVPTAVAGETPGEQAAPPPPASDVAQAMIQLTSVTLVVNPQDALVLKWAFENDAAIDLVLRSAVDRDIYAQPEAVTLQYMLDRFQISVPPKLPHAPTSSELEERLLKESQSRATSPVTGD
jgi:Flp pilus assembly protein CpaB